MKRFKENFEKVDFRPKKRPILPILGIQEIFV